MRKGPKRSSSGSKRTTRKNTSFTEEAREGRESVAVSRAGSGAARNMPDWSSKGNGEVRGNDNKLFW